MSVKETTRSAARGGPMLALCFLGFAAAIALWTRAAPIPGIAGTVIAVASFLSLFGLIVVNPNEAKVLLLFGEYRGSVKKDGWYWVNPFYTKTRISLRVRNFETERLKVNDLDGNPIEIAAVVVWKVVDTAEASFEVDDYSHYVHVQSESALRNLATHYPYDTHEEETISLRGSTDDVAAKLRQEIQSRLNRAGVEVVEARISHLAYAQEIAQAMLQRQQAGAIIARARRSSKGPSAWWRWPSSTSAATKSWNWTRSARRRWSRTCSSSSAPIAPPSPS